MSTAEIAPSRLARSADALATALAAAWVIAALTIPDRFVLPFGGRVAFRPHQAILLLLVMALAGRAIAGDAVRVGRAVVVAALPVAAAISVVANLDEIPAGRSFAPVRSLGEMTLLAVGAIAVAAVATSARRRRAIALAIVMAATLSATLGIAESVTGRRMLTGLPEAVPALELAASQPFDDAGAAAPGQGVGFSERHGVPRVAGAARHPIELSAVAAFGAVLAIGLAVSSRRRGARVVLFAAAAVMVVAIPLTVSRTGALLLAVAALVAAALSRRRLLGLAAVGLAAIVLASIAALVASDATSALATAFTTAGSDSSVAARTSDYRELDRAFGEHPWTGRGIGLWSSYETLSGERLLLDNQYLLSIDETGVIGLAAFLAVLGTAVVAARRWTATGAARRGERGLAVSIVAAVVGIAVAAAAFDALYFSQAAIMLMTATGLAVAGAASSPLRHGRRESSTASR